MTDERLSHNPPPETRPEIERVIAAAHEKKADAVVILDLTKLGAFTECFVLCSGASGRQAQAISDEVEEQLAQQGKRPLHREGYPHGEWVLLDYGWFVVHIFHERARSFYDLERLWRSARRREFPPPAAPRAADAGARS